MTKLAITSQAPHHFLSQPNRPNIQCTRPSGSSATIFSLTLINESFFQNYLPDTEAARHAHSECVCVCNAMSRGVNVGGSVSSGHLARPTCG